jgi:hypothetical protein
VPEETRTRIYPDVIEGAAQYFDDVLLARCHSCKLTAPLKQQGFT